MRYPFLLLLVLPLIAPALPARADDKPPAGAAKGDKLEVSIDRSKVDLKAHKLEVKLSRPADKIKLKVIGETGATLAENETSFKGAAAGTALWVSWKPSSEETVARIEVWGYDTKGYYAGVAILPWSVNIPHEEVNFQTDSDVIRPSEAPKLEASLKKIQEALAKHKDIGQITLFIVGHTDTVGTPEYNLNLSRRRARSIAGWFRKSGLRLPIAFEGLGESAPLVKTPDETEEARNRRVDYILALEPPKLPTGSWKQL